MQTTERRLRPSVLCFAGVAITLAATALALALELPSPTTEGRFEGTWYRVEPGQRQALQLRRSSLGDGYDVRLYWWTEEGFQLDTEWNPETRFAWRGFPGVISLAPDLSLPQSDHELHYTWMRDQEGTRKSRLMERGTARLYRGGADGRSLVFVIDPLLETVSVGEPIAPYEGDTLESRKKRVWIMLKVANRSVPWDEIPW